MQIIQPHYHGIARTAQDYERMAMSGVVAVAEPAFWAGFERRYPETFIDYFRQISEFEPTRAAQYGIRHYCWVAVNPKEAENPVLSREVLAHLPEFFTKPSVLGVGETGFHKTTKNEEEIFEAQVELAMHHNQLILIHTPHLADKVRGTQRTLAVLRNLGVDPGASGLIMWRSTRFASLWRPVIGSASRCIPSRNVPRNAPSTCWRCTATNAFWLTRLRIGVLATRLLCSSALWSFANADTDCRRRLKCSTTTPASSWGKTPSLTSSPSASWKTASPRPAVSHSQAVRRGTPFDVDCRIVAPALVLFSGGQDSTTSLYWALRKFASVRTLGFNYGQKHVVELKQARNIARMAGVPFEEMDIRGTLSGSALTEHDQDVNAVHPLSSQLPASFVPARNALFLTLAAGYAFNFGVEDLVGGMCQTDYSGYPDCRREFMDAMETALGLAMERPLRIHTPLMYLSKAETWKLANELGVLELVIEHTHTDYNGNRSQRHAWGYGVLDNPATMLRARGYAEARRQGWV